MARTRFLGMAVLSVVLLATQRQAGLSQYSSAPLATPPVQAPATSKLADSKLISLGVANDLMCKVYALSDLGDDPSLGKWVAETIPEVIQPGSWSPTEAVQARRKINYHAPSKILVIYHTAAVHAKVDSFLTDLKKAMPQDAARATNTRTLSMVERPVIQTGAACMPAGVNAAGQYTAMPMAVKAVEPPAPQASGYPVAAPLKQPKHLFHFIIRYEGEGLIDANVVKFAKAVSSDNATRNSQSPYAAPGTTATPPTVAVDQPAGANGLAPSPAPMKSNSEGTSSAPARAQPSPTQPPSASPPPSESAVPPLR